MKDINAPLPNDEKKKINLSSLGISDSKAETGYKISELSIINEHDFKIKITSLENLKSKLAIEKYSGFSSLLEDLEKIIEDALKLSGDMDNFCHKYNC